MSHYVPMGWPTTPSRNRLFDFASWERDTIQPWYGINLGVEYAHTVGVAELSDYDWYFTPLLWKVYDPEVAASLGIELGKVVVYYPRRAYNMWNTRYFIIPADSGGWRDKARDGFVPVPERACLPRDRPIYWPTRSRRMEELDR